MTIEAAAFVGVVVVAGVSTVAVSGRVAVPEEGSSPQAAAVINSKAVTKRRWGRLFTALPDPNLVLSDKSL